MSGLAEYLKPDSESWIDTVVASSTLPFVTKGKHYLRGLEYFDGGWSDPLPVKWAYEQGSRNIILIRTWPSGIRSTQSWIDYFGSIYFSASPGLKNSFSECYKKYNESLDFIANPPADLKIEERDLDAAEKYYKGKTIMSDYRYGLDKGLYFVNGKKGK